MAKPNPGQKTVLITGCSPGGIGHALCLEYHRQGLFVIATARRPEVLEDLEKIGLATFTLDVTSESSISDCRARVDAITGGRLDILINNAGQSHTCPATDLDLQDVRRTFETNIFSMMAMVKSFIGLLIAARGLIINTASASAVTGYVFGSAYAASKGAVISYSRALRLELEPVGVRVMCTMTGTVKSQVTSHRTYPISDDSLYTRVRDILEWRYNFSQKTDTISAEDYAKKLVADSIKKESSRALRTWFGRPDWFWYGGTTGIVWATYSIGEWLIDWLCYHTFKVAEMETRLAN